ncbi:hypothetical protein pb186bvf_006277 [Paramecium bursaria]
MQYPSVQLIEQSLYLILNAKNEGQRKQADQYLSSLEKQSPEIMLSLLDIFENNQNIILKQQSLILLKNVIIRNWSKVDIQEGQKKQLVPDQLKEITKAKILVFLGVIQDSKFKKEFNLILQAISKFEFPTKYPQLVQYFTQGLQTINSQGALSQQALDLIITLKGVVREVQKLRLAAQKYQQSQFTMGIWPQINHLWEQVTQIIITNPDELSLKMSKNLDRFLSMMIFSCHSENDYRQWISEVFQKLLTKTTFLMKNPQIYQANIKTLVHSLGNIQQLFSLVFSPAQFSEYLQLVWFTLTQKWKNQRIPKAALFGLIKVLKTYPYYCTDEEFLTLIKTQKNNNIGLIRQQIKQQFVQFFTQISDQLLELLIKMLSEPSDLVEDELSEEDLIEIEDYSLSDDLKSELHCPTYTLCMITAEQLMFRFPELLIIKVQKLYQDLLNVQFQLADIRILDGFFSILGILPKVTGKIKKQVKDFINILPALQCLSQSNQIVAIRRCCILINKFLLEFQENEQEELIKLGIYLMQNTQDPIVKYQALMCIRKILQHTQQNLQWVGILEQIAPVIINLLLSFQKANIVWPLTQLLQKLIEKTQYQPIQSLVAVFEQANLFSLMQSQQDLIVDALSEMFKSLIVSFPPQSNIPTIFRLALTIVQFNLQKKKSQIFTLYLFLMQEYHNGLGLQNELLQIFQSNQEVLLDDSDMNNISPILLILEEYILLNIIDYNQFPGIINLIELRIKLAQEMISHEIGITIMRSCLSLLTTIILIILNNNRFEDLQLVSNIILFLIDEFIKPRQNQLHNAIYCEVQQMTLLNRFIIQNTQGFIQALLSKQIQPDQYLSRWQQDSITSRSKGTSRINSIALLLFIKHVSKQSFLENVSKVLTEVLPEIDYYLETLDPLTKQKFQQNRINLYSSSNTRLSTFRNSERKEAIRQTQIYEDVDMKQFFINNFKIAIQQHNVTGEELQQFIQDDYFQKLQNLLNH